MSAGKETITDTPRKSSKKSVLTIEALFPEKAEEVKPTEGGEKDFVVADAAEDKREDGMQKTSSYEAESGKTEKAKDKKKEIEDKDQNESKDNKERKDKKGDEPKKTYCGADKNPCEIRYAQTIISRFRDFTVYEVMRSTTKKPPKVTDVTEGVFVVKKRP